MSARGKSMTAIAQHQAPATSMDLARSQFLVIFSKTLVYVTLSSS